MLHVLGYVMTMSAVVFVVDGKVIAFVLVTAVI
jgi:hypothetical protein